MQVFPDHETLSRAAANLLGQQIQLAVRERGRFVACLCGGTTPPRTYELLAQTELPWSRVHLFWGDERWRGEEGNHYESLREAFHQAALHPFPLDREDPPAAALAYEAALRGFFGSEPPRFDVAVQGLGADGHTASLFPGTSGLHEERRWATAHYVTGKKRWRLTLTYPVLEQARLLLFLVSGPAKSEALAAVLRGDDLPATRLIRSPQSVVFCDQEAAASIKPDYILDTGSAPADDLAGGTA